MNSKTKETIRLAALDYMVIYPEREASGCIESFKEVRFQFGVEDHELDEAIEIIKNTFLEAKNNPQIVKDHELPETLKEFYGPGRDNNKNYSSDEILRKTVEETANTSYKQGYELKEAIDSYHLYFAPNLMEKGYSWEKVLQLEGVIRNVYSSKKLLN